MMNVMCACSTMLVPVVSELMEQSLNLFPALWTYKQKQLVLLVDPVYGRQSIHKLEPQYLWRQPSK